MRRRLVPTLLLAGALAAPALPARAEAPNGGIALEQLRPSPPGASFVAVPSPFAQGHFVPRALALFDFASHPLVLSKGSDQSAVVGSQAFLHLGLSLTLWDRLLLGAQMPVALIQ